MLEAAPDGATLLVYSRLSGKPCHVEAPTLFHGEKKVEGFYLGKWMVRRNVFMNLIDILRVQDLVAGALKSHIHLRLALAQVQEALDLYQNDMTAGKVLLEC